MDVAIRPIADAMARQLGQPMVVDNRPSAGGIIGSQALAAAAPDGYTVGYGNLVTLAINASFFSKLPYNPEKDFERVGLISGNAYVLVARNELPVSNWQELLDYSRKHPGKLSVGSPGVGSAGQLAGELLKKDTGITMEHVPYKAGTQAVGDMVGGQLDLMIDNVAALLPMIQQQRIKALAVTSLARLPVLPSVPTLNESGVKGFDVVAWGGLLAPAGTPKAVVERLNAALRKALEDPKVVQTHTTFAITSMPSTPDEFLALQRKEVPRWADAVKRAGVKGD
ncbi:MAG: tripartite tricarboxylate transporter substrate binding protein [Hydrogenophaga sp.]|nr:tripartite tricarboxylate transporter substrate binding protein [Hydrogenophaga sp.]